MINDVKMHTSHDVICEKTREKDVVGIVPFDLICLLRTNNIIAYISFLRSVGHFARKSLGGFAKCWLFSQVILVFSLVRHAYPRG